MSNLNHWHKEKFKYNTQTLNNISNIVNNNYCMLNILIYYYR